MAQVFVCKNCGITFRGKASKKPQCCSLACRREAGIKARQRTCRQCGKEFLIDNIARDATYCSRECSGLAQRLLVAYICEHCGAQYEKRPSEQQKHCSRKCYFDAQRGQERPSMKGRTPWNIIDRPPRDVLQDLYETQHLTTAEVGNYLDVQSQMIRGWLHDYGIPVRPDHIAARFQPGMEVAHKKPILDKETLSYLYLNWNMTTRQIGEHYQVSSTTVGKWLKHHEISMRPAGTGLAQRGIEPPSAAELERMIHVENLTYQEVASQYGADQSAVMYWLDRAGISRPTTHFGSRRYETKDGIQVRSTYERNVANWLFDRAIPYVYEPRLPFSGRADFFANGWYIEIWGMNSANYKTRKAAKKIAYAAHNLPLIELSANDFQKRNPDLWKKRIARCLVLPS